MHHKKVYYTLYMNEEYVKTNQERLKKLIIQAKNGNSDSFEEVYTTYYTPLFRYILNRIKNRQEAEDLTQNVFMKIWKALPEWDNNHSSPISFFFTVARNTLIDYFRKSKSKEIVSDEIVYAHTDEQTTLNDDGIKKEQGEAIRLLVSKLSNDQQEIIKLYYVSDLTYKEISEITGKREEAIRQIHSRAIKKLREIYKY